MLRVLRAEFLKLRRANVVLWTALSVAAVPAISAGSAKAIDKTVPLTWEGFMRLAPQMMATWWGVLVFGLVAAYVFGREYFDGTAKNMLTLPVRRESFVVAKFVVVALWVAGLAALSVALQATFGAVLGIPHLTWAPVWSAARDSFEVAGLIYLTLPVVAALATLEKGYMPPMMFSAFMATAAFMVSAIGWGRYFPWSMPFAAAGSAFGPLVKPLTLVPASYAVDAAAFLVGVVAVLVYTDRADNTQ